MNVTHHENATPAARAGRGILEPRPLGSGGSQLPSVEDILVYRFLRGAVLMLLILPFFTGTVALANTPETLAMNLKLAQEDASKWIAAAQNPQANPVRAIGVRQQWGHLVEGHAYEDTPLQIGERVFQRGLGSHADGEVRIVGSQPMKRFGAWVGVDNNPSTRNYHGELSRIVFSVEVDGKQIFASKPVTIEDKPLQMDVRLPNVREFTLKMVSTNKIFAYAHADWADAQVDCADGKTYWVGSSFKEQQQPQKELFAFNYGGKPSDEILAQWKTTTVTKSLPEGVTLYTKQFHDPVTGLTVIRELKQFAGNPAVEWVVRLRNDGLQNTPIIENLLPLRLDWAGDQKTTFLHRSHGSHGDMDDFRYQIDPVPASQPNQPITEFHMIAGGGRSSDNWMPFYNLQIGQSGVVVAIGWSGQWAAGLTRGVEDVIHLTAGLEQTHFTLHPGEEIRTPSSALVFWNGEPIDGNNALRQFILDHHYPRENGQLQTPPITAGGWGGVKDATILRTIQQLQDLGLKYDYFWIDAGWFGAAEGFSEQESTGKWYQQAGTWNPNPISHPNGMRPISDAANKAGMKFLLWFEPERAVRGTVLPTEHPTWFLEETPDNKNLMLNLGNPEALKGLTELLSAKIKEYNIGCMRQDFNFQPLGYWRRADAPDRQGITETKYIMGLYNLWDELRRRYPSLLIDNCASGGRRLDLELVGRSMPLWRSDFQCLGTTESLGAQLHTLGLNYWLPAHGTTPQANMGDKYTFHGALSAAMGFGLPAPEEMPKNYSMEYHRARMAELVRARPFYFGDYYPLTPYSTSREVWGVYEMFRKDLKAGLVVALRRENCPYMTGAMRMKGLDENAVYSFENTETGKTTALAGAKLMGEGLEISLATPRSSVLYFFKETNSKP